MCAFSATCEVYSRIVHVIDSTGSLGGREEPEEPNVSLSEIRPMKRFENFVASFTGIMFNVVIAFLLAYALRPALAVGQEVPVADRLLAGAIILLLIKCLHEYASRQHQFEALHDWIDNDAAPYGRSTFLLFACTVAVPVGLGVFLFGFLTLPGSSPETPSGDWASVLGFMVFFITVFTVPDVVYLRLAQRCAKNGLGRPPCLLLAPSCKLLKKAGHKFNRPCSREGPACFPQLLVAHQVQGIASGQTNGGHAATALLTGAPGVSSGTATGTAAVSNVAGMAQALDHGVEFANLLRTNLRGHPKSLLETCARWLVVSFIFTLILGIWAIIAALSEPARSLQNSKGPLSVLIVLHCIVDWGWNWPFYFSTNRLPVA